MKRKTEEIIAWIMSVIGLLALIMLALKEFGVI